MSSQPDPDCGDFPDACFDMIFEFGRHCSADVDPSARKFLMDVLRRGVLRRLQKNDIEWRGRHRKFALSCCAGLGRLCETKAEDLGTNTVTQKIVEEGLKELVCCWERVCTFPTPPGIPGDCAEPSPRSQCDDIRPLLRPETSSAPA